MRKLLSIFMTTLILMTMPLNAFAAEDNSTYTHEELIQLACDVFPEYTSQICAEKSSTYALPRSSGDEEIIFTETRDVSDTETVSISVLSSGNVIIVSAVSGFNIQKQNASASTVGPDIIGSTTFNVTSSVGQGSFYLKNVGFIITQSGSGNFTSTGTPSATTGAYYNKHSSTSTYIHYALTFTASKMQYVDFEVYFSNGKVVGNLYT